MRKFSLSVAALVLLANTALADDAAELAKLKGKWTATALTGDGMEVPSELFKTAPWYWSIDGAKILSKRPTGGGKIRDEEIGIAIDSTKAPKTYDITDVVRKETNKGIYELDGDTLRICFSMDQKADRPGDFSSKAGSKRMLMVWKRVKE